MISNSSNLITPLAESYLKRMNLDLKHAEEKIVSEASSKMNFLNSPIY